LLLGPNETEASRDQYQLTGGAHQRYFVRE
jgi:hypothetical protein